MGRPFEEGRVASPAVSIEEIIPPSKKCRTGDKGREKMGASVWADAVTALAWANEVMMPRR